MRALKIAGIVVLALIAVWLLLFVLQRAITDESAAAANKTATKGRVGALHRAHRQFVTGHHRKMRRTLRHARIMRDPKHRIWHVRNHHRPLKAGDPVPAHFRLLESRGRWWLGLAIQELEIEQDVVGFRIVEAQFVQVFNFRRRRPHRIGDVSGLKVQALDVSAWGQALGYSIRGRGRSHGRWCGDHPRRHRCHYSHRTAAFVSCVPLGVGCVDNNVARITGRVKLHADGGIRWLSG